MRLPVPAPFHLEATVRLLQRRPANRIDVWDGQRYLRALLSGRELIVCSVRNRGTIDEPRLELSLEPRPKSRAQVAELTRSLRRMLGLDLDPSFTVPNVREARLDAIAHALRGARPPRFPTLFESFCRIIPYQQLSLEAGGAITARFVERFGRRILTPARVIWAFPKPEDVLRARARDFAGIGLNRHKVASLRGLAELLARGELTEEVLERFSTEAALRRLEELPGVGPWTAALILLRGLGRTDVFPAGDTGVLRGLRAILGADAPIPSIVARAGDRRGYLYFYSLGARLLAAGLIHPATPPASPTLIGGNTTSPLH